MKSRDHFLKVGQVVGNLTITSIEKYRARCSCKCGKKASVFLSDLKHRRRKSCGCLKSKGGPTTHGHTVSGKQSKTYRAWAEMRVRCSNKNRKEYKNYGGRGIRVCPLWRNSFEAFLAHLGNKPGPKYSLERIDNSKGYEPGNVRWATRIEQNRNTRRVNWVVYKKKRRRLIEIAEEHGLTPELLRWRIINRGLTIEEALARPKIGGPAKFFTYKGATHYIKEWAKLLGISASTISRRISRKGMTFKQAVESQLCRRSRGGN